MCFLLLLLLLLAATYFLPINGKRFLFLGWGYRYLGIVYNNTVNRYQN